MQNKCSSRNNAISTSYPVALKSDYALFYSMLYVLISTIFSFFKYNQSDLLPQGINDCMITTRKSILTTKKSLKYTISKTFADRF